jgi:DNA-binding NtrC family response regulator
VDIELALIIGKGSKNRDRVASAAVRCGLNPICCCSLQEARQLLVQEDFRLVMCEKVLPDGDFHIALREVKLATNRAPLILLSENADWGAYLKALAAGVFDCIICPASLTESERIVRCALEDTPHPARAASMAA